MNILFLISDSKLGGAQKQLLLIIKEIKEKNNEIFLGCPKGWLFDNAKIVLQNSMKEVKCNLFEIFKLNQFIKKNKIDIIHTSLLKAALFAGIIYIIRPIKIISTVNNKVIYPKISFYKEVLYKYIYKYLNRNIKLFMTKSISVKDELVKIGVTSEKVIPIINGINLSNMKKPPQESINVLKKEFQISKKNFILGNIGRYSYQKGQDLIIKAMPAVIDKYPNTLLLLIGEGEAYQELKELIKRLKLTSSVILTGKRSDISSLLSILDLFVFSSRYEGFPNALLEAMAFGVPVISTDVGGNKELLKKNKSGIIIKNEDVKSIIEGVATFRKKRKFYERIAREVSGNIRKKYNIQSIAKKYQQIFSQII